MKTEDVQWIVNDISELGVKIGDQCFFLYKGRSLEYEKGEKLDDGKTPMMYRPVYKREFGECCHPWDAIMEFTKAKSLKETRLPESYMDIDPNGPGDWKEI